MRDEAPAVRHHTQVVWKPETSPIAYRLSVEFKVALRSVGVGAPIDRLLQALASAGRTALLPEGIEEVARTDVLSVNPRQFPRLLGGWELTDPYKRELAGLVGLCACQLTHAWQSALVGRLHRSQRLLEAVQALFRPARGGGVAWEPSPSPHELVQSLVLDEVREEMAALVGQRVADAFTAWFGTPPGQTPVRSGPRLDRVSLGEASRRRLASTLAVTLHAGACRHLELRLLLAEHGDLLDVAVLDCRRRESGDRCSQDEADVAMESAVDAATAAARDAGFEGVCWSWLIRGAYPPVDFAPVRDPRPLSTPARR